MTGGPHRSAMSEQWAVNSEQKKLSNQHSLKRGKDEEHYICGTVSFAGMTAWVLRTYVVDF